MAAYAARLSIWGVIFLVSSTVVARAAQDTKPSKPSTLPTDTLPGTTPLTWTGDLADRMVAGADRFLLEQIEQTRRTRQQAWLDLPTDPPARAAQLMTWREELRWLTGCTDARHAFANPLTQRGWQQTPWIAETGEFRVARIFWPTVGDLEAEGLLLEPHGDTPPRATVIALPDADISPEMIALGVDLPDQISPFAGQLANAGCRVIVPRLLSRQMAKRNGRANLTHREFIYRSAFELGRHVVGYELQQVFALVDWIKREEAQPVAVVGYGEGGFLALLAGALDPRIDVTCVSGSFDARETIWQQPIDRNLFGLLERFGDAELAAMIGPRPLVIDMARGPEVELPSEGGAPATLSSPPPQRVRAEHERTEAYLKAWGAENHVQLLPPEAESGQAVSLKAIVSVLALLFAEPPPFAVEVTAQTTPETWKSSARRATERERWQQRLLAQYDRHNQQRLADSESVREQFMSDLDTRSLESFQASQASYRKYFSERVIGRFDLPLEAPRPRTRLVLETDKYRQYEVVLDVFPEVFAYGLLLVPTDLDDGEQRPVVVCQHGLEGRPQDVVAGDHRAYHDFAAKLAQRGFVTFAPQHLYIFGDRFRTLQRKANPLGKTLFSLMIPQHQQLVDWLQTLDFVDPERIAFYGLSYGGKSAMRIPAVVDEYCLSICSADFNDWIWKNASTKSPYSYVWTGEYEIFEFDLGSTFNYAEMAALIAPRPFMVERGHFDGVAPDQRVAYEFAKVRHLYAAQLGLPEHCEIEWFVGPHTIHGVGTFEFLEHHLRER